MIRDDLADRLVDDHDEDGYLFPAYDDYCYASVPGTVDSLLGADVPADRTLPDDVFRGVETDVENVVVFLLDGYGLQQWTRDYDEIPLLSLFSERGTVTPLTSIYPSETAAAITTLHTGLYAAEHGQIGWNVYYDEVGGIVQPLPHTTPEGEAASEVYPDATPEMLFDGDSRYDRLVDAEVTPTLSQPAKNLEGPYSERTNGAAELAPYQTVPEMAVEMRHALEDGDGRQYVYGYVPDVDGAAHVAGTESDLYRANLEATTECVRRELVERLDPELADDTLLVLTADHGHVDTVADRNVDLRDGFDVLWDDLAEGEDGEPIYPSGSARNVHLHLQDGAVPQVRAELEAELDCRTFTREEALDRGLFGPVDPGPKFQRRCGDLIVVGRDQGIWYDDGALSHVGMHGGLTHDEMLVPFAAAKVSDLQ